jgi:hypothetical protein
VLVSASYRLSFDLLRRELVGINCWILVLDTQGLGVGSAAASGLFSTDELVTRIAAARLTRVVNHRILVLPGRAALVIDKDLVAARTGFETCVGPARASEIPTFLRQQICGKDPEFRLMEVLAITPVEVGRSLMRYAWFAFAALLYAGTGPGGVNVGRAMAGSWRLLALGLGSVICGSMLAPVTYALIPRIPLWVHGALLGCAVTAGLLEGARFLSVMDNYLASACWMLFPAAASLIAVQFAQALPESRHLRGAHKSTILALIAGGVGVLVLAALVLSKTAQWRIGS